MGEEGGGEEWWINKWCNERHYVHYK